MQHPLDMSPMFSKRELQNRFVAIVPFTPFLPEEVRQVAQLELKSLRKAYRKSEGWAH